MAEQIVNKRCFKCKQIKHSMEFYKDRRRKDGLDNHCKICRSEKEKKYLQTEQGQISRKRYDQSKKGNMQRQLDCRKYKIRHPEKMLAKDIVRKAIRVGNMPHADSLQCSNCIKKAEQYHHYLGYSPKHFLDVIPVCRSCHKKIHQKLCQ